MRDNDATAIEAADGSYVSTNGTDIICSEDGVLPSLSATHSIINVNVVGPRDHRPSHLVGSRVVRSDDTVPDEESSPSAGKDVPQRDDAIIRVIDVEPSSPAHPGSFQITVRIPPHHASTR